MRLVRPDRVSLVLLGRASIFTLATIASLPSQTTPAGSQRTVMSLRAYNGSVEGVSGGAEGKASIKPDRQFETKTSERLAAYLRVPITEENRLVILGGQTRHGEAAEEQARRRMEGRIREISKGYSFK